MNIPRFEELPIVKRFMRRAACAECRRMSAPLLDEPLKD
jgi:hypothetical protein